MSLFLFPFSSLFTDLELNPSLENVVPEISGNVAILRGPVREAQTVYL